MPKDDIPRRVVELVLEQLRNGQLPPLIAGGAWMVLSMTIMGRLACAQAALKHDICGTAVAHLRTMGSVADWVVRI